MSARQEETKELIRELEALRNYLMDDSLDSGIPVLRETASDVSEPPAPKTASVSYLNIKNSPVKSAPQISEAMKEELRSQASPLIQELVDREMIQLEQRLIQTLNQRLEHWMDSYTFHQSEKSEPDNSYYHSN